MRERGFTLAELLVAIALGALLLALAAPAMSRQRGEAALRSASTRVLAALQLARREALARGHSVTACPTVDGVQCSLEGSDWLLFANLPGGTDGRRDPDDEILQRWSLPQGVLLGGTRGYAAFQPRAGAATTVTFNLCHASSASGIAIIVSQSGRPRVSRGALATPCGGR
jgi:type IV fimbrial biogenesis protein FimT